MRRRLIAVIGVSKADARQRTLAREVGRRLARAGFVVITGGLGGVMEAASRGAAEAGGLVVGVLPSARPDDANRHVQIAVATGMGDARNAILCNTADGFIAIGRGLGTLSEVAFALKRGKPVVSLGSWQIEGTVAAHTAEEAVRLVKNLRRSGAWRGRDR